MLDIPMKLDYTAQSLDGDEDITFDMLVQACTPVTDLSMASRVPKLDLTVVGRLHVWGLSLVWKPEFRFSLEDVPCPANAKPSVSPGSPGRSQPRPPSPSVTAIVASQSLATPTSLPTMA